MKKTFIVLSLILLSFSFISCNKKSGSKVVDNGITFKTKLDYTNYEADVYYNDNFFYESSTKYNYDRMKTSFMMAQSTCDYSRNNKNKYINDFLINCNFKDVYSNEYYYKDPERESVAFTMANKKISYKNKEYTLIPVAIKSTDYYAEFASNMMVGKSNDHYGFSVAKKQVLDGLFNYIDQYNLNLDNIKIWVCGYSRGAAISNLVSKSLNQYAYYINNNKLFNDIALDYDYNNKNINITIDDIYSNNFETPACGDPTLASNLNDIMSNIFNAYNPNDWICKLYPELNRYGKMVNITLDVSLTKVNSYLEEFGSNIIEVFKGSGNYKNKNQNQAFDIFYKFLCNCLKANMNIFDDELTNRDIYYEYYQESFVEIFGLLCNDLDLAFDIFDEIKDYLFDIVKSKMSDDYEIVDNIIHSEEIKIDELIINYLDENNIEYNEKVKPALIELNNLLITILSVERILDRELSTSDILNITSTNIGNLIGNANQILYAHYPNVIYAYILSYKG